MSGWSAAFGDLGEANGEGFLFLFFKKESASF